MGNGSNFPFSHPSPESEGWETVVFPHFHIPPENTKDVKASQLAVFPSLFGAAKAGKGWESAGKQGFPILSSQNIAKKGWETAAFDRFPIPAVFSRDVHLSVL